MLLDLKSFGGCCIIIITNENSFGGAMKTLIKNARIVSKKLITVGRLHPQKNHEMLIRAFKIIEQKFSDWNLEIYGDGELYEYLQTIITDLGLTNRVSILPSNSDIYRIISNSSIFVVEVCYNKSYDKQNEVQIMILVKNNIFTK